MINRIGPSRGSRTKSRLLINRFRQRVGNPELDPMTEALVRRNLELVAMGESVTKVSEQLLRTERCSRGIGRVGGIEGSSLAIGELTGALGINLPVSGELVLFDARLRKVYFT